MSDNDEGRRRSPIIESRWLLAEIRQMRGWAGVTQRDAAKALGWPTSKLSMVESGQRPLHTEDLTQLLAFYEVPGQAWDKYLAAGEIARKTEWWDHDLQHGIEDHLRTYTGLEQAATRLATFQTCTFDGLLQTPEYTAALLRQRRLERVGPALVEHLVRHRGRRQEALRHPTDPLGLHMVVLEQALKQRVGDREVMKGQLDHLLRTATTHANVTVQVVADEQPMTYAANYGPFTVFAFPPDRGAGVVVIEHMASATLMESTDDLNRYTALFEQVCELALTPDESLHKVKTLREQEP